MITTITVSGADKSGSLARISAFLARNGYSVKGHHFTDSASGAKLLVIKLEGDQVDSSRLSAELKSLHPDYSVVDVAMEGGSASGSHLVEEMASQFPDIASLVHAYADSFSAEARDKQLSEAGKKVGTFIYTRDWSLGSPLKMPIALRRTLVPALEKFCKVDATDTSITLPESPLCGADDETSCCEFLAGFMQGFLNAGRLTRDTQVQKAKCRNNGDPHCTYTFKYAVDA